MKYHFRGSHGLTVVENDAVECRVSPTDSAGGSCQFQFPLMRCVWNGRNFATAGQPPEKPSEESVLRAIHPGYRSPHRPDQQQFCRETVPYRSDRRKKCYESNR